jgi:hypothetical protein
VTENGSEYVDDEPEDNRTAFERFEALTKRLIKVPKAEIDKARKRDDDKRRKRAAT